MKALLAISSLFPPNDYPINPPTNVNTPKAICG